MGNKSKETIDSGYKTTFVPVPVPAMAQAADRPFQNKITATCTLKGEAADLFEKMVSENNLNRSLLARQMIYHCLGMEKEMQELAQQATLWGR